MTGHNTTAGERPSHRCRLHLTPEDRRYTEGTR